MFLYDALYGDDRRSLRVAYNAIFRRIFKYGMFESLSNLQRLLGRNTWEGLVDMRCKNVLHRARCPAGSLVQSFC